MHTMSSRAKPRGGPIIKENAEEELAMWQQVLGDLHKLAQKQNRTIELGKLITACEERFAGRHLILLATSLKSHFNLDLHDSIHLLPVCEALIRGLTTLRCCSRASGKVPALIYDLQRHLCLKGLDL